MAINAYEGMFILDSNRFGRDQAAAVKWIQDLIENAGGEILVSRLWDERRLAYPINGHRKGTYWITYIRIEGDQLAGMSRDCEIGDLVLRHLFVKIHPTVIDALVQHAESSGKTDDSDKTDDAAKTGDAKPTETASTDAAASSTNSADSNGDTPPVEAEAETVAEGS